MTKQKAIRQHISKRIKENRKRVHTAQQVEERERQALQELNRQEQTIVIRRITDDDGMVTTVAGVDFHTARKIVHAIEDAENSYFATPNRG